MEKYEINESFIAKVNKVYFKVTKFNGGMKRDSILISSHGYQGKYEFDDTTHNDIDNYIEELLNDLVKEEGFLKLVHKDNEF